LQISRLLIRCGTTRDEASVRSLRLGADFQSKEGSDRLNT
jgi:hypothetical protein